MIPDSHARFWEVRRQEEEERALYEDQGRLREIEIQHLHRALQEAAKMRMNRKMQHE